MTPPAPLQSPRGLVSVIIVSHGDVEPLKQCLDGLANVSYPSIEIRVARFGTKDILDKLPTATEFPISIIPFVRDVGVAAARNELAMSSKGEYIAFLDDDTIPTPTCIAEAIGVLSNSAKIGAVQSLLLDYLDPSKIDGAGSLIDISGYPLERGRILGVLEGRSKWSATDLFGACSAAMVVKTQVFKQVGGFDQDFIIEMEDLDLSWRIRLAGYDIRLAEKSKVLHRRQSKRYARSVQYQQYRSYNGLKNQMLCIAKNMGGWNFIKFCPIIVMSHMVKFFMPRGRVAYLMTKALFWNLRNLKTTIQKRYVIQHSLRRRSDNEILTYVIRLPILLADILVGTGATLRTVRSLDEAQLHVAGKQ